MKRELICISCPIGCMLTVDGDGIDNLKVSGNACKRGEVYGVKEVTAPTRTVTSTIWVTQGDKPLVSVRTQTDIPKDMIGKCMGVIQSTEVQAPVSIGDVVIENVVGTGVNVIATTVVNRKGMDT